jgi:hypothetical protein
MKLLAKLANLWVILILAALFLLINIVIVPAVYPKFQTLDSLFWYSPAQAYQLIDSYGVQGRHAYAVIEWTLDLVYPFISALMFSLLIFVGFKKGYPNHPSWQKLALIPFAVMAADYLENISVAIMLLAYPARFLWLAFLSSIFSAAKIIFTPLELIFVVGFGGWFDRSVRAARHAREIRSQ